MDEMKGMQPGIGLAPPGVRTSGRTRWWIVWTLFFSTVTNYISRQTFSVLAPMLVKQYHFSIQIWAGFSVYFRFPTRLCGWWEGSSWTPWAPGSAWLWR